MNRLTPARFLVILLVLALSACGGGGTRIVSNLSSRGQDTLSAAQQPAFVSIDKKDVTARATSGILPDRRELLSDAAVEPIMPERKAELSAVITYPDQTPAAEPEAVTAPEPQPELIGSKSVQPGPSAEELSQALSDELARLGIDPTKTVSAPPSGNENQVMDLKATVVDPDGTGGNPPTGIELSWTEVFVGDYDQNTEVGISDLSPLGNKFLGTVTYNGGIPAGDPEDDVNYGTPPTPGSGADNWRLSRIDGDHNGEINIADITPIATHFAQTLTGYRIYRKGPGDADFVLMDDPNAPGSGVTAPRSYAIPEGQTIIDPNRPVRYHFVDAPTTDGNYEYYVVPFDATSSGEGVASLHANADFITVTMQPPVASLQAVPLIGMEPLTVSFDASGSTDPDGTITKYEWDWENDGTYDEDTGTTPTNTHEYTAPGFFVATVRVHDNDGLTAKASVNIEVQSNQPPTAVLDASPTTGFFPLDVNFDATASSDTDGTITKFEWDWEGDGTYDDDTGATGTNTHTYTTAGVKQPTVRVTDDGGATATASKTIQVNDPSSATLFDIALSGVLMERSDLNLGDFPDQVSFQNFVNYGNDTAGFDLDSSGSWDFPDEEVPGSRFGSFTNYWHNDHTALPTWASGHTDALDNATNLEQIVSEANNIFFEGDERQTFFAPPTTANEYTPDPSDPLGQAVINLITNQGGTPNEVAILTDASDVPTDVQQALSKVIQAADAAATARDNFLENDTYWSLFFGPYDPGTPPDSNIWDIAYNTSHEFVTPITITYLWPFYLLGMGSSDGGATFFPTGWSLASTYAYDEMAQAALDLSHALDAAESTLKGTSGTWSFDQDTPIGRVLLNSGDGNTVYSDDEYLLILDVDGDDTYNCPAGANAGTFNSVSINIDVSGNDVYSALDDYQDANGLSDDTHSQQGCGRMGVGMLIDYAGNDTYNSSVTGQGCAILGWGLLYDEAGDDTYFGVDHVQGSAFCGIGVLYDAAGTDSYTCWSSSQGFGDIWGVGILNDAGSDDDTYLAQWDSTAGPADFEYDPDLHINASLSQGSAFGLRTTSSYPVIWDGGVGILNDQGGSNDLTCGYLGQGQGFWFATGVCNVGGSGSNTYGGVGYVQGAGPLFSASIMHSGTGDDSYNADWDTRGFPLVDSALASGQNHCVSWFLDNGGSDTYVTPRFGLGTGRVNAWAYFIDMGPDADTYGLTDPSFDADTLGRGHLSFGDDPESITEGDPAEQEITFGLFLDCGGADTYDGAWASLENGNLTPVSAGNDRGWFRFGYDQNFPDWRLNEFGTGYDGEGESGFEP